MNEYYKDNGDFKDKFVLLNKLIEKDLKNNREQILITIDKILDGSKKYAEINGLCAICVDKDVSKIYDNEDIELIGDWCQLPTKDLKEIIMKYI